MISSERPDKRIETVYRYFSHHIRTNTAVIVAMLEAINEGLSDESMSEMIMESGYLLDIFDRGMSVSFNHIFGKEEKSVPEPIELLFLINLFVNSAVTKDGSCTANINIPEKLAVICEPYSFKSLLQIFLHETVLACSREFTVSYSESILEMLPDKEFYENPPAFAVFKEIFSRQGITVEYDKKSIRLRFPDESINS